MASKEPKRFTKAGMYIQLKGVTMSELSKSAKVSPSFLQKLVYLDGDGYTYIPKRFDARFWSNLTKVMKALNCTMEHLI